MYIEKISDLEKICTVIRKKILDITFNAKSGHVGGCLSSVELLSSLYFGGILRYSLENPHHPNRDRVLIRGHLGPLRYTIFSLLGWIDENELKTYRHIYSRLEGHEDMKKIPGVDITPSGSLGMTLSYGCGVALSSIKNNKDFLTYVFLGDGEEQEGNVSEAARHISSLGLENIITIIDKNKKQLSRPTNESDRSADIAKIWEGYGWKVKEIDGHNIKEVLEAYNWAIREKNNPKLIIANTIKGFGIPVCELHYSGYHTFNTVPPEVLKEAILYYNELTKNICLDDLLSRLKKNINLPSISYHTNIYLSHKEKKKVEFRKNNNKEYKNLLDGLIDYFQLLTHNFKDYFDNLYVLTSDLIRKDIAPLLGLDNPLISFIDCGIREQHMNAMAHGIVLTDKRCKVILDVGEEFLYRHADQLNVLSQAKSPVVIIGNMGGICGAKNGPTHQPSGQSGMLTLMPNMTCLEPADVDDLFNVLNFAISQGEGPVYIRMHSGPLPSIEDDIERSISYYVIEKEEKPEITLVGNGLTLKGCIDAFDLLKREGIPSKVINVVNRNSLDQNFVQLIERNKPLLTVYNGNPNSLSYPVSFSVMRYSIEVINRPSKIYSHGFNYGKSGSLEDLIKFFKFDGEGIVSIVKSILK